MVGALAAGAAGDGRRRARTRGLDRDVGPRAARARVAVGYGERLEAVVGADRDRRAAARHELVLPQVYWTDAHPPVPQAPQAPRRRVDSGARVGFWSAQVVGFGALGLTSVYREGFETVLFLQSLELATDATTVIEARSSASR
jgi:high-affinity iron transporter